MWRLREQAHSDTEEAAAAIAEAVAEEDRRWRDLNPEEAAAHDANERDAAAHDAIERDAAALRAAQREARREAARLDAQQAAVRQAAVRRDEVDAAVANDRANGGRRTRTEHKRNLEKERAWVALNALCGAAPTPSKRKPTTVAAPGAPKKLPRRRVIADSESESESES
jgi:hypothetical protein